MLAADLKRCGREIWEGKRDAFATVLVAWLLKAYGPEVLEWDPDTIAMQLKDDLDVQPGHRPFGRAVALITALTTDAVYHSAQAFDAFVDSMVADGPENDQDIPSAEDVAWAVAELAMSDPDHVGDYGPNVAGYVRVVLNDEGLRRAPALLEFAEPLGRGRTSFGGGDDGRSAAGSADSAYAATDELDDLIAKRALMLHDQMAEIGINVPPGALAQALELESPAESV